MITEVIDFPIKKDGYVGTWLGASIGVIYGGYCGGVTGTGNCVPGWSPSFDSMYYRISISAKAEVSCYGHDYSMGCSCTCDGSIGRYSVYANVSYDCTPGEYSSKIVEDSGHDVSILSTKYNLKSGVNVTYTLSSCACSNSGSKVVYGFYSTQGLKIRVATYLEQSDVATVSVEQSPEFEDATCSVIVTLVKSSNSNIVQISSGKGIPKNTGECQLTYRARVSIEYPGKSDSKSSLDFEISKSVKVQMKKTQIITFLGPNDFIVGSLTQVVCESTSGLTDFLISSTSDKVTVLGNSLIFSSFGLFDLTIVQSGNDEYLESVIQVVVMVGIDNFNPILLSSGGYDYEVIYNTLLSLIVIRFLQISSVGTFIFYKRGGVYED